MLRHTSFPPLLLACGQQVRLWLRQCRFREAWRPRASCIVADAVGTTPSGGEVGVLVWASGDVITGLEVYDLGVGDDDITLPVPNSIHGWGSAKT